MKELNSTTVSRSVHPVRILQFGEGNFLRAFVDWQIDIANEAGVTDMSVAIVPPRFHKNRTVEFMQQQDNLYHVVLEGIADGKPSREVRLIGSVAKTFAPEEDMESYESLIVSPELRFVVSNTTEAGIRFEEDDDASAAIPRTFPAKITALLHKRYKHFEGAMDKGIVFIPCELITDNGSTLREYVIRHARMAYPQQDFISWIENACTFCDSLVDRIVSGFPVDSIDKIKEETGFDDNLVVKGELYHLWVIGCKDYEKVRQELPLDKAGLHVLFLPSVDEYRERKVRILNGSHTGMVPMALQMGCETVLDAFNNTLVNAFINKMIAQEVLPQLEGDEKELQDFADGILERFYNPYIRHMLKSIALNSLSKWETRNWPTVKDMYDKQGRISKYALFTFASLLMLYGPETGFQPEDNAEAIALIHDVWNSQDYESTVRAIVGSNIFIEDFEASVPGFSLQVAAYLQLCHDKGMAEAVQSLL